MCALSRGRDVTGREVAQAAVHELRAESAGPEGEILGFYQRHTEPARDGVQSDTHARDTAPDDEDVDRLVGCACEFDPPSRDVERG